MEERNGNCRNCRICEASLNKKNVSCRLLDTQYTRACWQVGGEFLNGSTHSSQTTNQFGIALHKFGKVINKLSNYDEGFKY